MEENARQEAIKSLQRYILLARLIHALGHALSTAEQRDVDPELIERARRGREQLQGVARNLKERTDFFLSWGQ